MQRFLLACAAFLTSLLFFAPCAQAWPTDIWSTHFVEAASPIKAHVMHFHDLLLWIITIITILVTGTLLFTLFRFRRSKNPVPSKRAHNVPLEIVWTLIPCIIVLVIMWFSFPLMYYMDVTKTPDMTLKVTGYQWYWGYSYPDQQIEEYSVYMIPTKDSDAKNEFEAARGAPTFQRLLSTYELSSGKEGFVVLPINKNIRVQITGNDVIHSWSLPAMGVKKDAVPGRLNETWLRIDKPGIYYGQCSQLCGTLHGFMPIEVRAVDQAEFDKWAGMMKTDTKAAFAMVQADTVQYANKQIIAPNLTLRDLWDKFGFKTGGQE
jgi:cytochrome c oxidase subunit 2